MILGKTFDLKTFTHSDTADRLKIDNTEMTNEQLECLKKLHSLFIEIQARLSAKYSKPINIQINSAFRSVKLNEHFVKTIGASKTSQHMSGQAGDTVAVGITLDEYFNTLKSLAKNNIIVFGQVIQEFGSHPDRSSDDWIHISTSTQKHINEFMIKKPGQPYQRVGL